MQLLPKLALLAPQPRYGLIDLRLEDSRQDVAAEVADDQPPVAGVGPALAAPEGVCRLLGAAEPRDSFFAG
jgi:hypothetical protein